MTFGFYDMVRMLGRLRLHCLFKWLAPGAYFAFKRRVVLFLFRRRRAASGGGWALRASSAGPESPRVSVVVPNYNHAPFLRARLDSIYGQTYANFEVILLDDASPDDSVSILREYRDRHPDRTRLVCNAANSGQPFAQWARGIALATGELVWIAESDDTCDPDFLARMVPAFRDGAVRLAMGHTDLVMDGARVWTVEEMMAPLTGLDFTRSFAITAHNLVNSALGFANCIPNASGCVFRRPRTLPLLDDPEWKSMRICGDWVFYLNILRGGVFAYVREAENHYRQHASNTSVTAQGTDRYYREHQIVGRHLASLYRLSADVLDRLDARLKGFWERHRSGDGAGVFTDLFDVAALRRGQDARRPNVAVCGFAFTYGGGETMPIVLANELNRQGYCVTFVNFGFVQDVPEVRARLDASIPVLDLGGDVGRLAADLADLGVEIVHTHHVSCDVAVACNKPPRAAHVVTLHGMYETLAPDELRGHAPLLRGAVDAWVSTADKNVRVLRALDIVGDRHVAKIPNGLPRTREAAADRRDYGIPEDAFLFCLVSRAIPEKGWREAVEAVGLAREASGRDIRLLLVGSGEMCERYKRRHPDFVTVLEQTTRIRPLFAMSDMGLLPSRFPGESFPLVIIDALFMGKPVVATDIGEIGSMLRLPDGSCAGDLVGLEAGFALDVAKLSRVLAACAADPAHYAALRARVEPVAARFDIAQVAAAYGRVYARACAAVR